MQITGRKDIMGSKNEQLNFSVKKLQKIRKAKQAVNNLNVFLSVDKQDKTKVV